MAKARKAYVVDNLRRGISSADSSDICSLCEKERELIDHRFFYFASSIVTWSNFLNRCWIKWCIPGSLVELTSTLKVRCLGDSFLRLSIGQFPNRGIKDLQYLAVSFKEDIVRAKFDIVRARKMGTNEEFENIIPSNILHN